MKKIQVTREQYTQLSDDIIDATIGAPKRMKKAMKNLRENFTIKEKKNG